MSVDLAELLGTQETVNLEFKRHGKDRDKISKAICALSNDLAGKACLPTMPTSAIGNCGI